MDAGPARAGLYWRRGPRVTPGVMSVEAGWMSFVTDEGVLFHVPIDQASASFSRHGTLTITVGTGRFDFVTGAFAGPYAPAFSPGLVALLTGDTALQENARFASGAATMVTSNVVRDVAALTGSALGSGLGIVGGAIGTVSMFRSQHASFALARAWAETLAERGVAVAMRGSTYGRSQLVVAAIVVPSFVVLVVGVYALVTALG